MCIRCGRWAEKSMRILVAGEPVGAVLRRTGGGNIEADGLDLDERWLHLNELRRHGNTGVGGGVSTGVDHNQLGGDGDTGGTLTEEARPALGSAEFNSRQMDVRT